MNLPENIFPTGDIGKPVWREGKGRVQSVTLWYDELLHHGVRDGLPTTDAGAVFRWHRDGIEAPDIWFFHHGPESVHGAIVIQYGLAVQRYAPEYTSFVFDINPDVYWTLRIQWSPAGGGSRVRWISSQDLLPAV